MNDSDGLREQVSALLDGQLRGDDFGRAVEQVCAREELRDAWRAYHLVGDVLRSGEHAACRESSAFMQRFRERLATEGGMAAAVQHVLVAQPLVTVRAEAANEPVFRWKLVAGIASVAAAAAIGWNWVGTLGQGTAAPQIAQQQQQQNPAAPVAQQPVQALASGPVPASAVEPAREPQTATTRVLVGNNPVPQVMLRDPRLDALLEAHQQAGGGSHMPSGFLRNATFEGQSR